jgi:hypothetical protein
MGLKKSAASNGLERYILEKFREDEQQGSL